VLDAVYGVDDRGHRHALGVHRLISTMLDGGDVEAVADAADLLETWVETSASMSGRAARPCPGYACRGHPVR